jgi:FAD:protein FMN transferase
MGCELVVAAARPEAFMRVSSLFERYDRVFSRFRADSELSRVNAAAEDWVEVSPLFAAMLRSALAAARATDGLIDPTLGVAIEAAGYDRDFALLVPDGRPAAPGPPCAWQQIVLRGRVLLPRPGIRLDLNGVVKAAAVDAALPLAGDGGFVSAGGDVATARPLDVAVPRGASVRLVRGALATSGTITRRWLRAGTVVHHLIDPRTGRTARSPWAAVTVAGATCVAADVAAKAAFLAAEDGPDWLDERGLPGRFLSEAGDVFLNRHWLESMSHREAA